MKKAFLCLLGVAYFSGPASAQQPPVDYIAFRSYAEIAAQVTSSIQSCKRMGFSVRDDADLPQELLDRAMRMAVGLGLDRVTADSILLAALKDEGEHMWLLSSVADYVDTPDELISHFQETITFWDGRCRSLAESSLGSEYSQVSGNEEAAQQALIDRVVATAKGAPSSLD